MQRILEEACWEIASRWVPTILLSRNWTCSEAVELSAWKKFLPDAIPYRALASGKTSSYSLEMGLTDAVRVRNAAVHRHLCDNSEIRLMAMKAQQLMEIFSDGSRREKFVRLKEELSQWDMSSKEHRDDARRRLENALKEIGEQDMDDMDWSPNAVSLHELKENEHLDGEAIGTRVMDEIDEMDLD